MNEKYEIALKLCGLDPENDEDFEKGEDMVDEILQEKYGIDAEQFEKLIDDLMPFAHLSRSLFTEKVYIGFADHERGVFLCKKNINQTNIPS